MVFFMNKMYLLLFVVCATVGAYFYGANIADMKCRMKYANYELETNKKITTKQKAVRDVANKTGVDDIRRILRDKYTIAQ